MARMLGDVPLFVMCACRVREEMLAKESHPDVTIL
jgi:hypothetical protein